MEVNHRRRPQKDSTEESHTKAPWEKVPETVPIAKYLSVHVDMFEPDISRPDMSESVCIGPNRFETYRHSSFFAEAG